MNPRQMQQMMKRMGISQTEIDAHQVIIKTTSSIIYIDNPSVARVNAMGQDSFQISGDVREETIAVTPDISDEDISIVMEQTGVSRQEAQDAIKKANGDLAQAILLLQ